MSDTDRDDEGQGGIKLDLSINLPTILTMVCMLVTAVLYVNNRFADLANQDTQTDVRMGNVERRIDSISEEMNRIRSDTVTQTSALRAEIRSDMRDLKQSMDDVKTKMMGK